VLIPERFSSADLAFAEPPVTPPATVTVHYVAREEDVPSRSIFRILLLAAALALACVGITMNGWFARSLGSSDAAEIGFASVDAKNPQSEPALNVLVLSYETIVSVP
jgi:hypothetical protein